MEHLYVVLTAAAVAGCATGPAVQPAIVRPQASVDGSGSFELTLYLPPEASEATDVWLYTLRTIVNGAPYDAQLSFVETFPITLAPGMRVHVPMDFRAATGCPMTLAGTVYDVRLEVLVSVSSSEITPSGCR